ncbi:hypothetical protein C8R44DRAFT_146039 [Mycena epipterygia]|nr:hypothetical protein C8R44DRAFT_146039 [Mycena epipterygia]
MGTPSARKAVVSFTHPPAGQHGRGAPPGSLLHHALLPSVSNPTSARARRGGCALHASGEEAGVGRRGSSTKTMRKPPPPPVNRAAQKRVHGFRSLRSGGEGAQDRADAQRKWDARERDARTGCETLADADKGQLAPADEGAADGDEKAGAGARARRRRRLPRPRGGLGTGQMMLTRRGARLMSAQ